MAQIRKHAQALQITAVITVLMILVVTVHHLAPRKDTGLAAAIEKSLKN